MIATGAQYRKLPLENLSRFEGAGIYYGATFVEEQLCGGEEVIVVGGGNSAGQGAVFLAQTAKRVYMLVRSDNLSASMSRYLIRRIENSPTIILRLQTEIVTVNGKDHLESVYWRNSQTGQTEKYEHKLIILIMTGADPNTHWLDGCVALDDKGFIKTGPDLSADNLSLLQAGLLHANHTCLKPVCQVFSLLVNCARQYQACRIRSGRRINWDFVCS